MSNNSQSCKKAEEEPSRHRKPQTSRFRNKNRVWHILVAVRKPGGWIW